MSERDYSSYQDKAPGDLHTTFATWISDKTGIKVDAKSVWLAVVLHGDFQRSPENKARNAERKANKEATLKARAEKKEAAAKPVKKTSAPKPAAAKKTAAKPAAKKAAPAKKAAVKKPATKPTGEAPF